MVLQSCKYNRYIKIIMIHICTRHNVQGIIFYLYSHSYVYVSFIEAIVL